MPAEIRRDWACVQVNRAKDTELWRGAFAKHSFDPPETLRPSTNPHVLAGTSVDECAMHGAHDAVDNRLSQTLPTAPSPLCTVHAVNGVAAVNGGTLTLRTGCACNNIADSVGPQFRQGHSDSTASEFARTSSLRRANKYAATHTRTCAR